MTESFFNTEDKEWDKFIFLYLCIYCQFRMSSKFQLSFKRSINIGVLASVFSTLHFHTLIISDWKTYLCSAMKSSRKKESIEVTYKWPKANPSAKQNKNMSPLMILRTSAHTSQEMHWCLMNSISKSFMKNLSSKRSGQICSTFEEMVEKRNNIRSCPFHTGWICVMRIHLQR